MFRASAVLNPSSALLMKFSNKNPILRNSVTLAVTTTEDKTHIYNKKNKIISWWILFGVAITFLTLLLAGAFKKKK